MYVRVDGMTSAAGRRARAVTLASGGVGLVASLALEADLLFESGLWYPVFYAGAPAVAATVAFAHACPATGPFRLARVGAWFLASSVLALPAAVVLSLGFPAETPRSPVSSVVGAALIYAGFLAVRWASPSPLPCAGGSRPRCSWRSPRSVRRSSPLSYSRGDDGSVWLVALVP